MSAKFNLPKLLCTTVLTIGAAAFSTLASAQNLGVSGNSVTISVPGTAFNEVATISAAGAVSAVTGVPTTGSLTTPSFSFTLQQTGAASTSGTYAVGIMLDEQGSDRRLEVFIPGVDLTFDAGGNLTGTLSTPNVNIYGRDALGATAASAAVASGGSVNFNGSTLTFSAANQIALIQGEGGILADITTSINNTGLTYDYTVILKRTAGTTYSFTHDVTGTPTAFPAAGGAEFVVAGSAADAATLSGGQKLTGTVSFGGVVVGGGGGDDDDIAGQTDDAEDATNDVLDDFATDGVTDTTIEALETVVDDTGDLVEDAVAGLESGDVPVDVGIQLGNVLLDQLSISLQIANDGELPQISTVIPSQIIANVSSLLSGYDSATPAQQTAIETQVNTVYAGCAVYFRALRTRTTPGGVSLDTLIADITPIMDALNDLLTSTLANSGNSLDNTLFDNIVDASQASGEALLNPLGTLLGLSISYESDSAAQAILSQNPVLLDRLVDLIGINAGGSSTISENTTDNVLRSVGLSSSDAAVLSESLTAFAKADDLSINAGTGSDTVDSLIAEAVTGVTAIDVNNVTSTATYSTAAGDFAVLVRGVMPAAGMLPSGTFAAADGSTIIIANGLVFELAPAPSDLVGFAGAIQTAGAGAFTTSISESGLVSLLDVASGAIFSATMSDAALSSGTGGATTFEGATGDPADSSYRIVVEFEDGTRQDILPAIADPLFYESVANAGFQITTDRSTGLIQIDNFSFRPDYFITPITVADSLFRVANDDSVGVAYRAVDANGDGVTDYQVVTQAGVQTVYGLP